MYQEHIMQHKKLNKNIILSDHGHIIAPVFELENYTGRNRQHHRYGLVYDEYALAFFKASDFQKHMNLRREPFFFIGDEPAVNYRGYDNNVWKDILGDANEKLGKHTVHMILPDKKSYVNDYIIPSRRGIISLNKDGETLYHRNIDDSVQEEVMKIVKSNDIKEREYSKKDAKCEINHGRLELYFTRKGYPYKDEKIIKTIDDSIRNMKYEGRLVNLRIYGNKF